MRAHSRLQSHTQGHWHFSGKVRRVATGPTLNLSCANIFSCFCSRCWKSGLWKPITWQESDSLRMPQLTKSRCTSLPSVGKLLSLAQIGCFCHKVVHEICSARGRASTLAGHHPSAIVPRTTKRKMLAFSNTLGEGSGPVLDRKTWPMFCFKFFSNMNKNIDAPALLSATWQPLLITLVSHQL